MIWNTSIFCFGKKNTRWEVDIRGKSMVIECSPNALKALDKRGAPLFVMIEIAMACFARKSVSFAETMNSGETIDVTDKLAISVQTVAPNFCKTEPGATVSRDTPTIKDFIPKWLRIDYHNGEWRGECGLSAPSK